MNNSKGILPKDYLINKKYKTLLFIKKGSSAETYRLKGMDGKLYFLKLFNYAKLPRSAFNDNNDLLEIEFLRSIKHPNIVNYVDSGELVYDTSKFIFLVLDFIPGETLAEKFDREPMKTVYDIKEIISGVLSALSYLHSLPDPIIHNEISPQNIMLDLSGKIPIPKIIDFGYARSFHQSTKVFNKEGLNLNYLASECFNGLYSPLSDIFSVGAVTYYLLFGIPPWYQVISKFKKDRENIEDVIMGERRKLLNFQNIKSDVIDFDDSILKVINKALQQDPGNRFHTANEFIQALNGEIEIEVVDHKRVQESKRVTTEKKVFSSNKKGSGFDAVSGMDELKRLLTIDVIDALRNPEKYKRYDISFPNGILFYGPPRCGKTFFAKKFAEEVGYNYMYIKPSTLKSRYVNATQENIAKMFEEAEKNAPTIIFIDELNELVPNRESDIHEMALSAVNEMLAQMDRTGDKGIFIIGATNYPNMIDPAILGAGRIEKKVYIGPPDFKLRKTLFQSYLKNKPLDLGIDYDKLGSLTENYVTGDIELLVNEAAKKAMLKDERVSMEILEQTIKEFKPTIALSELIKYESIKREIEEASEADKSKQKPKFGF